MVLFNQRKGDTDEQVNTLRQNLKSLVNRTLPKIEYVPNQKCFSLTRVYID